MSVLKADYFDGQTSKKHEVSLMLSGGKLKVVGRDVQRECDLRRVRRSLRVGNTPRWLYLPDGGACVTADNDAIDRITQTGRYERALQRWEAAPAYAALAVALVVAALWLLVDRGVPAAVEQVAERIPVEAEAALGREVLESLEKVALEPSALSLRRQAALKQKFEAMANTAGEQTPYRLEFRASPVFGANAFALPAGIIVMTDELVKLSRNDQEVLGVLAHELGHVRHRHTMRRLLEASITALVIAAVTGDVASATSLAAAAPTLLLHGKYSRDNEREADRYAIDLMRRAGLQPRYLASLLARLEGETPGRGLPTFLSTHPATEERAALARAADAGEAAEEDAGDDEVAEDAAPELDTQIAERPKLVPVDRVQREVLALLEKRDAAGLERLLGEQQLAFEQDPGKAAALENAYSALDNAPRSSEDTLNEWVQRSPESYAALAARGTFYMNQGLEARGTKYLRDTPAQDLRAMHAFFEKARADLEKSLGLSPKPYVSRLSLMTIARTAGSRDQVNAHYQAALKLAPQSVELRLDYMTSLEPRWGGSYRQMEAFVEEARKQLQDRGAVARLAARIPANRAHEAQNAKDYDRALKYYDESIALHPAPGTLCSRSWVLSQLKRDAEAFNDVKLALAKARDIPYCLQRAVYQATKLQRPEEAIAVLELVLEVDRNNAYAFGHRGWRYQQLNKPELAFADFLAAARLGDAWSQLQAGKYLWAGRGVPENKEEALVWLRKAAEQGHPDAKLSLQQALQQMGRSS